MGFKLELQVLFYRFRNRVAHHLDYRRIVDESADAVHASQLVQYYTAALHDISGKLDICLSANVVFSTDADS